MDMGVGAIRYRMRIYPMSHILGLARCKSRRILCDDYDEMVLIIFGQACPNEMRPQYKSKNIIKVDMLCLNQKW
jgi:hypothetical protein